MSRTLVLVYNKYTNPDFWVYVLIKETIILRFMGKILKSVYTGLDEENGFAFFPFTEKV